MTAPLAVNSWLARHAHGVDQRLQRITKLRLQRGSALADRRVVELLIQLGGHQHHHIALHHRALPVMAVIKATQQRSAQRLAIIASPLIDDQPATGVELGPAVVEKTPGQMADAGAGIGVQVDEDQVRAFRAGQQLHGITDTHGQARIIFQAQVLHGQARYIGAQLDGFHILEGQEPEACLGQVASTEPEEQRGFRRLVAQGAHEHRAGVVVFQPARVSREHAALLDRLTELKKAVFADLDTRITPKASRTSASTTSSFMSSTGGKPGMRRFSTIALPGCGRAGR